MMLHRRFIGPAGIACLVWLLLPTNSPAEPPEEPRSPITEKVRSLLRGLEVTPEAEKGLAEIQTKLTRPADMRDVLLMTTPDLIFRTKFRGEVAEKFQKSLTAILTDPMTPESVKEAYIAMIGGLGNNVRDTPDSPGGYARRFGPLLADLAERVTEARTASTIALNIGLINPSPKDAAKTYRALLAHPELKVRRMTSLSMLRLVDRTIDPAYNPIQPSDPGRMPDAAKRKEEDDRSKREQEFDVIRFTEQLAVVLGIAMTDEDTLVHAYSARATSKLTVRILSGASNSEMKLLLKPNEYDQIGQELAKQTVTLCKRLKSSDVSIRRDAASALEALAGLRQAIVALGGPPQGANQFLRQSLIASLPELSSALRDSDFRTRLAAAEALEAMGTDAAPVAADLARACEDSASMVRWVSARVLGMSLAPKSADIAVPALTRLLTDPDLDVRRIAVLGLVNHGKAARSSVPAIAEAASKGDPDFRVEAYKGLAAWPDAGPQCVAAIQAGLTAPAPAVRIAAAKAAVAFGPGIAGATDALKNALTDGNDSVRRYASDALLAIAGK